MWGHRRVMCDACIYRYAQLYILMCLRTGDGYLLIHDVNASYGSYLIAINRMWDAIHTVDIVTGTTRGLIRITEA